MVEVRLGIGGSGKVLSIIVYCNVEVRFGSVLEIESEYY